MYPKVKDPKMVGEYSALAKAGGGYFWDEVLEYRVWFHDNESGDFYYAFEDAESAIECFNQEENAGSPLALVLQKEYINEPETGVYFHMKEERITEWPIEFLSRPRRDEKTIPNFLSSNAPSIN